MLREEEILGDGDRLVEFLSYYSGCTCISTSALRNEDSPMQ